MSEKVSIGILAVQGAFAEHQAMLDGLGADTFLIRQKKDLEAVSYTHLRAHET